MTGARTERGSAAVLATVLAGVLLVTALAAATAGGLLVGQRRAAAAADLAALAGAEALAGAGALGPAGSEACTRAAETAAANGAALTTCQVAGSDLLVSATVDVGGPFGMTWPVEEEARAGPATVAGGRGP